MRSISGTDVITTITGDGTYGFSGDGGRATLARVANPQGVAVDASGNVYIADAGNSRIRMVTKSTGNISTVAGNGSFGYSGDGGLATSARLYYPYGVAVDASGNVYIADTGNHRIRMVTNPGSSGTISTVAGNGTAGFSGDGQLATSALHTPFGVAVDASGNVYIADTGNSRIRMLTKSTGVISTVAGNGSFGYSGDGGLATSAQLNAPRGIAVDASGNVYIADTGNCRIRMVTNPGSSGTISTVAGNGSFGYSGDGGRATSAGLGYPFGVAVDASGNVYIPGYILHRIRMVMKSTGNITTVVGDGTAGFNVDGELAISARLNAPYGLCLDASGNIYIADVGNQRIRRVGDLALPTASPTPSPTASSRKFQTFFIQLYRIG